MNKVLLFLGILWSGEFICSFESLSQWASPNGPGASYINCLSANGTTIYAGTSSGVFSTTDDGGSWRSKNSGMTKLDVACVAHFGANLFADTSGYGVFLSTDDGITWNSINNSADILGC